MDDIKYLEKEAFLFAEDLFSDLMTLHPMFRVYLPEYSPTRRKSTHFTHSISKSVMVIWHELRNGLKDKYRKELNAFSKGDAALKKYLEHLCGTVRKTSDCKFTQVLGLSAVLLELIAFLYRRGYTHFLYSAPIYWLFMFKIISSNDFYKEGGWEAVKLLSKEQEVNYDNSVDEIYWQYWALDLTSPVQNIESISTHSAERSSGIVTDFAPDSVIAEKAVLKTISEDKVSSDFKGEKPSGDTYTPKTSKIAINRHSKEIFPKGGKALDSKDKGSKPISSQGKDAALVKRSSKFVPQGYKGAFKKSAVSEESTMSKISSAPTEKKHITPPATRKTPVSRPVISKYTPPEKLRVHKTKSEGTSSKALEKSCSPVKKDFVTIRTRVPKTEDMPFTIPTTLPKLEYETSTETVALEEAIPAAQGAAAVAIPRQKEPRDVQITEAGGSNTTSKERSSKKSTPLPSQKQSSSKKVSKDIKPVPRWR